MPKRQTGLPMRSRERTVATAVIESLQSLRWILLVPLISPGSHPDDDLQLLRAHGHVRSSQCPCIGGCRRDQGKQEVPVLHGSPRYEVGLPRELIGKPEASE